MDEDKDPKRNPRLIDWQPDPAVEARRLAVIRKRADAALVILHRHDMPTAPPRRSRDGSPNLTRAVMEMIAAYQGRLEGEMAKLPPRPLPSGIVPTLLEQVPEAQLASLLAAIRHAAQRLVEEDDSPSMAVLRFFQNLERRRLSGRS